MFSSATSSSAGSNFAQTTKEAAWKSYRAREEAQLRHVIVAMRRVKTALAMESGDDERRVTRAYQLVVVEITRTYQLVVCD